MTKLQVKVDFTDQIIYVGLDIHLKSWHVTIYFGQRLQKSFRQDPCPKKLANFLKENYPGAKYKCAYESGFSGFWVQRQLAKLGIECIIVNAADVPQTNKGMHFKTDKVDSKRIGVALESGMLQSIYIPDSEQESDRHLVRCNERLGRDLTRCKQRIKSMLYQIGIAIPQEFNNGSWSNKFVQWLKDYKLENNSSRRTLDHYLQIMFNIHQEKQNTLKDIRQMLKQEHYSNLVKLLRSVCGVGQMTAITLTTEIIDMRRFRTFDALNCYIGFCPNEYTSGEKQRKGHMSFRLHKRLRSLLIEDAWIAIRHDPALSYCFYKSKMRLGEKRAIIVIARKLLGRIRAVWLSGKPYEKGIISQGESINN
ncbi:MAG: IS110 family transposase [Saprospiraceae bacterium]|jgi:transposase